MEEKCLFCKIASGAIPADIVYEDDAVVAFKDIHPKAPVHVLVVPRKHISRLDEVSPEDTELLGKLVMACNTVAKLSGITDSGYRVVANTGFDAGQEVFHVHFHVLGGAKLGGFW